MLNQRQIAKHWGVAKSYVARCVKKGCPLNTYGNADKWRAENTRQRTPPKKSENEPEKLVNQTGGQQEPESEENSSQTRVVIQTPKTGDSMLDALNQTRDASYEAGRLLFEAMRGGNTARISTLVSVHTKAVQALLDTEARYREELERRKVLINRADAKAESKRGYDVILRRLKAHPQKVASQVVKLEPVTALVFLEREVADIIDEARRQYVD